MCSEEQESNGSSEVSVATGYSPRDKAAGNAHLTLSLRWHSSGQAVKQTAQQALYLGRDAAKENREKECFVTMH